MYWCTLAPGPAARTCPNKSDAFNDLLNERKFRSCDGAATVVYTAGRQYASNPCLSTIPHRHAAYQPIPSRGKRDESESVAAARASVARAPSSSSSPRASSRRRRRVRARAAAMTRYKHTRYTRTAVASSSPRVVVVVFTHRIRGHSPRDSSRRRARTPASTRRDRPSWRARERRRR